MLDDRIVGPEMRVSSPLERILYLTRLPVIGSLPAPALAAFADQMRERFFPRGAILLREGEPVRSVHFVVDGTVHVTRKGRPFGHAGPGAAVGGMGVFVREDVGVGAKADTNTLVLELEAEALFDILEDDFLVLHHVLREVCRQVRDISLQPGVAPFAGFPPAAAGSPAAVPSHELDLVEKILVLRRYVPFKRGSVNALAELSRQLMETRFEPGGTLWQVGEASGWVSLLVEGTVEAQLADGRRFRVGPGAPLGALESLAEVPRWYTPAAETPVVTLSGSIQGLIDMFEDNYDMAMDYLAVMAKMMISGLEASVKAGAGDSLQKAYGCVDPGDPHAIPEPREARP